MEEAMWRLRISQGNMENTESKSQMCVHIPDSIWYIACHYSIEKIFLCEQFSSTGKCRNFLCDKLLHENFRSKKRRIMGVVTFCSSLSSNNVMYWYEAKPISPPVIITQMELSHTPTALMECLHLPATLSGMLMIWRRCGYEKRWQCDGSMS